MNLTVYGSSSLNPQRNIPNNFKIHHKTALKDLRNVKNDKIVIFTYHSVDGNINFETAVVSHGSTQINNYVSMVED